MSKIFYICLIIRLFTVFVVSTSFVPDELFQSLEPAHRYTFNSGHLTWEWRFGLRSPIHVLCISFLYQLLQFFNLDNHKTITVLPRILHAIFFAFGDESLYKVTRNIFKDFKTAQLSLFLQLSSWFLFYCAPRTLSNCIETTLFLIALRWYPFHESEWKKNSNLWKYISIGMVSIIIRPTAILLWIPLGCLHLWRTQYRLSLLFKNVLPCGVLIFILSLILDFWFYEKIISTLYNFAMFNVFTGGSAFFGSNPWYYYLVDGLPAVLTTNICFLIGYFFVKTSNSSNDLMYTLIFYVFFHSLLPHKEHRFLLPIVPISNIYGGYYLRDLITKRQKKFFLSAICITSLINISFIVFFSIFHQAGPLNIIEDLRLRINETDSVNVLYLTPCYNLPQYVYFHDKPGVSIRALDCSPNIEMKKNYLPESDEFNLNPVLWIDKNRHLIDNANYIIIYEHAFNSNKEILLKNFFICHKQYHGPIITNEYEDNYLYLLCKN
uniref:Mannosyltransferase n=1 Tax=Strongyloides stercoralis TaxID=6248 RepID=A0A0K0DXE0_STRER